MPTQSELKQSSELIYEKFGIPTAALGVDGVHIRIGKKPNAKDPAMPVGVTPKVFRNRKNFFSLNVQIVGDAMGFIRDLECRWPGKNQNFWIVLFKHVFEPLQNRNLSFHWSRNLISNRKCT